MFKNPTTTSLRKLLASQQYIITEERLVQDKIEQVLKDNHIPYTREVKLSDSDRIDFLIGTIGVEVKLKAPVTQVTRQLHRYAYSDDVTELLLVTTSPSLNAVPSFFNNKQISVLLLITALI